jgi:hypothetical protein
VFEGHKALVSKGGWPDRASIGIPALYVNSGLILSEALESSGDAAGAKSIMALTEQVARSTRIDEFFTFMNQRGPAPLPGLTGDSAIKPIVPGSLPPRKKDSGN